VQHLVDCHNARARWKCGLLYVGINADCTLV
jgi:hypothetical protein